jgi:hypothetical protein
MSQPTTSYEIANNNKFEEQPALQLYHLTTPKSHKSSTIPTTIHMIPHGAKKHAKGARVSEGGRCPTSGTISKIVGWKYKIIEHTGEELDKWFEHNELVPDPAPSPEVESTASRGCDEARKVVKERYVREAERRDGLGRETSEASKLDAKFENRVELLALCNYMIARHRR